MQFDSDEELDHVRVGYQADNKDRDSLLAALESVQPQPRRHVEQEGELTSGHKVVLLEGPFGQSSLSTLQTKQTSDECLSPKREQPPLATQHAKIMRQITELADDPAHAYEQGTLPKANKYLPGNDMHLIQHLVGHRSLINQEPLTSWKVSLKKGHISEEEGQWTDVKCTPIKGTGSLRPKDNLQLQSMTSLSQILAADLPQGLSHPSPCTKSEYPKGVTAAPSARKSASACKISVLYGTPQQQPKDKMSLTRKSKTPRSNQVDFSFSLSRGNGLHDTLATPNSAVELRKVPKGTDALSLLMESSCNTPFQSRKERHTPGGNPVISESATATGMALHKRDFEPLNHRFKGMEDENESGAPSILKMHTDRVRDLGTPQNATYGLSAPLATPGDMLSSLLGSGKKQEMLSHPLDILSQQTNLKRSLLKELPPNSVLDQSFVALGTNAPQQNHGTGLQSGLYNHQSMIHGGDQGSSDGAAWQRGKGRLLERMQHLLDQHKVHQDRLSSMNTAGTLAAAISNQLLATKQTPHPPNGTIQERKGPSVHLTSPESSGEAMKDELPACSTKTVMESECLKDRDQSQQHNFSPLDCSTAQLILEVQVIGVSSWEAHLVKLPVTCKRHFSCSSLQSQPVDVFSAYALIQSKGLAQTLALDEGCTFTVHQPWHEVEIPVDAAANPTCSKMRLLFVHCATPGHLSSNSK